MSAVAAAEPQRRFVGGDDNPDAVRLTAGRVLDEGAGSLLDCRVTSLVAAGTS